MLNLIYEKKKKKMKLPMVLSTNIGDIIMQTATVHNILYTHVQEVTENPVVTGHFFIKF